MGIESGAENELGELNHTQNRKLGENTRKAHALVNTQDGVASPGRAGRLHWKVKWCFWHTQQGVQEEKAQLHLGYMVVCHSGWDTWVSPTTT